MTDNELITFHGGVGKLASKLDMTMQRVSNWRTRGIPASVKLKFPELFLHKPRKKKASK